MSNKEFISNRQAISIGILFIIGEASIFIEGIEAGKDLWIAIILALLVALPVVAMFARLQALFPENNLFDIIQICFGKYIGKLLITLYIGFGFYSVVLIVEDLSYFIKTILLYETPFNVILTVFVIICVLVVKHGAEVLGRWSEFIVIIPVIITLLTIILLIGDMNFNNIQPILGEGIKPVLKGTFLSLTFPFAFLVGMTMAFSFSKTKNSTYKIYFFSLIIGAGILLMTSLTNLLIIGEYQSSIHYYPSIVTVRRLKISEFLQSLEVVAATLFILGIYVESSTFFLATCKGITKLFGFDEYRFIVIPVALLVLCVSSFNFESMMDYFEFGREIWPYHVLPFEIFFPFFIWVVAEIKVKNQKISGY